MLRPQRAAQPESATDRLPEQQVRPPCRTGQWRPLCRRSGRALRSAHPRKGLKCASVAFSGPRGCWWSAAVAPSPRPGVASPETPGPPRRSLGGKRRLPGRGARTARGSWASCSEAGARRRRARARSWKLREALIDGGRNRSRRRQKLLFLGLAGSDSAPGDQRPDGDSSGDNGRQGEDDQDRSPRSGRPEKNLMLTTHPLACPPTYRPLAGSRNVVRRRERGGGHCRRLWLLGSRRV